MNAQRGLAHMWVAMNVAKVENHFTEGLGYEACNSAELESQSLDACHICHHHTLHVLHRQNSSG